MSSDIHWYPGHMKKASNELAESLKIIDVIVELRDARAPLSSANPFLENISSKPRVVVLMKSDLADPLITEKWIKYFSNNFLVTALSIYDKKSINKLKTLINDAAKNKREREKSRGIKPQPIRTVILGVPNVGKSSLINALSNKKITQVANKPGLTRNERWIRLSDEFDLLDTPGILASSYENPKNAINLALIGCIKQEILPIEQLSDAAYKYVLDNYSKLLINRYGDYVDFFNSIANKRGFLDNGEPNLNKARIAFLNDLKNGAIGRISFEIPHA